MAEKPTKEKGRGGNTQRPARAVEQGEEKENPGEI